MHVKIHIICIKTHSLGFADFIPWCCLTFSSVLCNLVVSSSGFIRLGFNFFNQEYVEDGVVYFNILSGSLSFCNISCHWRLLPKSIYLLGIIERWYSNSILPLLSGILYKEEFPLINYVITVQYSPYKKGRIK